MMLERNSPDNPFSKFLPVLWTPPGESDAIYSVTHGHGVKGNVVQHNFNDSINENKTLLDRVILEYKIDSCSYPLYTVGDFFEVDYLFEEKSAGNITGDLAERISRRIVKYFLQHLSKYGKTGGIFDSRFDPQDCNNYIVANTEKYILKIDKYPNLIILKNSGTGKRYGYENIKELDGLFDYRFHGKRHILVLESKLDKLNIRTDLLVKNLFIPLRTFFPEAEFSYILFSDKESIFRKRRIDKVRELTKIPVEIFETLKKYEINFLAFAFREKRDEFIRMKDHLITQYKLMTQLDVEITGKMILSSRKIVLFDGGETPRIKLVKDHKSGMWKEVKLTHKN